MVEPQYIVEQANIGTPSGVRPSSEKVMPDSVATVRRSTFLGVSSRQDAPTWITLKT